MHILIMATFLALNTLADMALDMLPKSRAQSLADQLNAIDNMTDAQYLAILAQA